MGGYRGWRVWLQSLILLVSVLAGMSGYGVGSGDRCCHFRESRRFCGGCGKRR